MNYIEVKYHFFRDLVARDDIILNYNESKSILVKFFTLPKAEFSTLRREFDIYFAE